VVDVMRDRVDWHVVHLLVFWRVCGATGMTAEVRALFDELRSEGVVPKLESYAIRLELCARERDAAEACRLMDEMEATGKE
jgi:pentatricopeptide repeat protein